MAQVTAQAFADRWAARMADPNTQNKIKAGVQNPRRSWQQQTLAAQNFMISQWNQACTQDGKWFNSVSGTSNQYWQNRTLNKGLPNMANGIANGKPAVMAFASQFLPAVANASAAAQSLPRGGIENGVARAAAFIRSMGTFRYNRPAR